MTRGYVLDLFCGAGLVADGWTDAGYTVRLGVDLHPQPAYPYPFQLGDALDVLADLPAVVDRLGVTVVWASPPCQVHTRAAHLTRAQGRTPRFADLVPQTLEAVRRLPAGVAWVVENVEGAPLEPAAGESRVVLCGSAFGLGVRRHRVFLTSYPVLALPCEHRRQGRPWGVYHVPGDSIPGGGRTALDADHARALMGVRRAVPWRGLKEGIPPAFAQYLADALTAAGTNHAPRSV